MAATLFDSTPQRSNMPIEKIQVTDIESDYRAKNYQDSKSVKQKQIVCSSCGTDLRTKLGRPGAVFVHPFTSMLQCKKCKDFYGDGDFSMDEDGADKYCRMCGNGGELYLCGNKPCPYGFCLKCIERYVGKNSSEIEADDWKCLHCNCKPLWEARAICAVVLVEHTRNRRKYNKKPTRAEFYDSDDICSLSEDKNNSYENSKTIGRHSLRSKYNNSKNNTKSSNLKEICDSSTDSSDRFEKPHKTTVQKENSNARSSCSQSSASWTSVLAKRSSQSAKATKRTNQGSASSENENTIDPAKPKVRKTDIEVIAEPESENKQCDENSTKSLSKQKEVICPKSLRLMKLSEKVNDDSDSSDQESVNYAAKSQNNRKVEKANKTTEKTDNSKKSRLLPNMERLYEKVDAATKSKRQTRSLDNVHPSKRMKEVQGQYFDTSKSEETSIFGVRDRQSMKSTSRRKTKDSDNKRRSNSRKVLSSESSLDEESKRASVSSENSRRIALFSLNKGNKILDKKKLTIKHSFAKVASTKANVNKNQAKVMRDHTLKFIREMDKFGKALSMGVDRINKKYLHKTFTKVPIVSKTILKCALLMNRCQKELNRIDHEFMEYYNEWCESCKVSSILPEMKNSVLALSSDDEMSPMRSNSIDTSKVSEIRSNSESEKTMDNTTNSERYDTVAKVVSEPSASQSSDNHSAIEDKNNGIKSVASPKNRDHSESSQKINETRLDEKIEETVSDGDLRNSGHEVSEFESDVIFSEDESSRQAKKANESQNKDDSGKDRSPETFEKATKSISDEHKIMKPVNAESSKNIVEECPDAVATMTKASIPPEDQGQFNKKKTDRKSLELAKESSDKSRAKEFTKGAESSYSSFQDIFGQTSSPLCSKEKTDHRGKKCTKESSEKSPAKEFTKEAEALDSSSRDISDQTTSPLCSKDEEFMDRRSTLSHSDSQRINYRNSNLPLPDDNESTLQLWAAVSDSEMNLNSAENVENLQNNSDHDSFKNSNRDDEDFSDCDNEIIFTQLMSKDSCSKSKANHITHESRNNENIIDAEVKSGEEIQLQKNTQCVGNEINPKKTTPRSSKPSTEENEDKADVNTSKKMEKLNTMVLGEPEKTASQRFESKSDTSRRSQDQTKDREIIATKIPSPKNRENDSENDIDESEEKDTDVSEKKKMSMLKSNTPKSLFDSEEKLKRRKLDFDSGLSEEEETSEFGKKKTSMPVSSTAKSLSDSEVAVDRRMLESDSELAEEKETAESEKKKASMLESDTDEALIDSEKAIKRRMLESDSELSEEKETVESEKKKASMLESDTGEALIDSEKAIERRMLESDSELSEEKETVESEKKKVSMLESETGEALIDSEKAIKRRMLESDSELSDNMEQCLPLNDFELRLNSDSDEDTDQLDSAQSNTTLNSDDKSENTQGMEKKRKKSSSPVLAVDEEVDLNKLAKSQLLSSSSSISSDTDSVPLTSTRYSDNSDSEQTDSPKNGSKMSSSFTRRSESPSSNRYKIKKTKFILDTNLFYKTDNKLRMKCEVVLRRLNKTVLDQFRQLLEKSQGRQESKKFQSLIDLKTINKRKRDTGDQSSSSSESASVKASSKGRVKKTKSKEPAEKEETLLDYLEKMKNGENDTNISTNETEENDDVLKEIPHNKNNIDELAMKVNQDAKDLLIQSSDSENETRASIADTEEEKAESDQPKTKKDKRMKNKEAEDLGSNHENGSSAEKDNDEAEDDEEKVDAKESGDSDSERTLERKKMKTMLAKRNWKLSDTDSESEKKKWDKSQSKEENEEEKDTELKNKNKVKRKKNTKSRVLGSDSDSVQITDESDDDSVKKNEGEKKSASDSEDSTELFDNLRKKRRKKRNAAQKTDSDSESSKDSKPVKQKRKRIKHVETDSDSNNDGLNSSRDTSGKLHRKNIRPVLKNKQIADVTKIAGKEEEERLKRISERQKLYNEMYEMKLASEAKVDKLVLDFDEETKKELISVHEDLVNRLKPHQAQGIKFMWDACFESLERTKTEKGSGCIVAHCMGLGKTFQVVTLAHTLLTHPETGIKTVMVVCPLSTVLNWVNEFKKWLGDINNGEDVEVYEMTKMKKNYERKYQLEKWHRSGGVMILGYEMFRLLSNQKGKKMRKNLHEAILKCLLNPGPDLIVCDEGHLLKNEDTALSKAMRKVNTLRRIVLTGTPLQNNLVEYHCMVQFVKPNLLGTKKEFSNRFVNPITNGQFDDSTEYDVKLMKKRAHVLHKMLEGSVQRFDYSVLTPFLPPKQEYVITVRLADIQIKLYQYYIDNFSRKTVGSGTSLFADFQALQRIWTHPIVLRMNAEKMEKINEKKRLDASDSEGSLRDFLDDGSEDRTTTSSDSDIQSVQGSSDEKTEKSRRGTRANPIDIDAVKSEDEEAPQAGEWWSQFIEPEHFEDMRISSKLVLLFAILKESEQIGDKVLVFSQSLYALSLIEEFLNKIDDETQRGTCSELIDGHSGSWSLGLDYFRLDGQTAPENRSQYCKIFNNPKNSRARLFLISTRAGGLGINLTAANRVIIFDASWNPSHDVQSIFRIYRFGQRKPCYVYRFLAQGTMEETIYNRQVTKLSLSCRVVDEQQIERHYSNHDLAELYQFEPNTNKEKPTLNLPKDRLLAEIFRKYEDRIETFHEHDSLLENKAEEELDEEERKEAWKEYEDERMGRKMYMNNFNNQNYLTQQYNEMLHANQAEIANRATLSGINIENLEALIRKDYPNATPEHQKAMTARTIMEMYAYMENETIRQQHLAAAASSFTYPTASNFGTTSSIDKNVMTPAQRQYVFQQQQMQQQQLQQMMQREQQANYAKRFGNTRIPVTPATATRPPQVVDLHTEENEVVEVPTTPPAAASAAGPATSSSVQTPATSAPAENNKKQEE